MAAATATSAAAASAPAAAPGAPGAAVPALSGSQRRSAILTALADASPTAPLSGAALGERFGVSRQVIVQDIALLRADGAQIDCTNRGYFFAPNSTAPSRLLKVQHSEAQIAEELNLIVDLGGSVADVMVNHRTYGRISAPLGVKSRRDVAAFLANLDAGISDPLSAITDGYHFHTVSAESEAVLDEIEAALEAAGFLAPWTAFEEEALR